MLAFPQFFFIFFLRKRRPWTFSTCIWWFLAEIINIWSNLVNIWQKIININQSLHPPWLLRNVKYGCMSLWIQLPDSGDAGIVGVTGYAYRSLGQDDAVEAQIILAVRMLGAIPSTQYTIPSTQMPSTQYPVPNIQYPIPSIQWMNHPDKPDHPGFATGLKWNEHWAMW